MKWLKRLFRFRLMEIDFAALWCLSVKVTRNRRAVDRAEAAEIMAYREAKR